MNQDQRLFDKLAARPSTRPIPDPKVKPNKATRRKMSAKYKLSILEKTDAMVRGEIGAFRRSRDLTRLI